MKIYLIEGSSYDTNTGSKYSWFYKTAFQNRLDAQYTIALLDRLILDVENGTKDKELLKNNDENFIDYGTIHGYNLIEMELK